MPSQLTEEQVDALEAAAKSAAEDVAEYTTSVGTKWCDDRRVGRMLAREPRFAELVPAAIAEIRAQRARRPLWRMWRTHLPDGSSYGFVKAPTRDEALTKIAVSARELGVELGDEVVGPERNKLEAEAAAQRPMVERHAYRIEEIRRLRMDLEHVENVVDRLDRFQDTAAASLAAEAEAAHIELERYRAALKYVADGGRNPVDVARRALAPDASSSDGTVAP